MKILTGLQPSGKLHLGNYFSVIKKMVDYQENNELYCFVANLHSLTTFKSREEQVENTYDAVCDLLALGIDPEKSIFWLQSDLPLINELSWYLSMCISVNQLSLAHSYKDKVAKGVTPNAGLYFYPILMAADILAFNCDKVPVGKDQKQHLEFARDIALKFNKDFGETFRIPEPEIDQTVAIVPGIDGQKMSKSYGNTINLFDSEQNIKKTIMSIITDSSNIDEPKDPDQSVIYQIFSLFLNDEEKKVLRQRFGEPGLRYGDLKKELLGVVLDYFAPYREKREKLAKDKASIQKILNNGKEKAALVAAPQIEKARYYTGIKGLF